MFFERTLKVKTFPSQNIINGDFTRRGLNLKKHSKPYFENKYNLKKKHFRWGGEVKLTGPLPLTTVGA